MLFDSEQPVKLAKVWSEQQGKYGESLGWQIFGIEADNQVLPTHLHTWKIDFASKPKELSEAKKCTEAQRRIMETPGANIPTRVGGYICERRLPTAVLNAWGGF